MMFMKTEARKTNCGPRTGIWLYKQIPKHSNLNLMVECQCVCDPRTRDRNGGLRDSVHNFHNLKSAHYVYHGQIRRQKIYFIYLEYVCSLT